MARLGAHGIVPICVRYDLHEKVWSEPLPYLFQNVHAEGLRAMSTTTMWRMIRRAAEGLVGAALLGHLNIQTTRGYVAVFDDDVVRHHQQFPRADQEGMVGVLRALRQVPGRTRLLRTPLRNPLPARTRLHPARC